METAVGDMLQKMPASLTIRMMAKLQEDNFDVTSGYYVGSFGIGASAPVQSVQTVLKATREKFRLSLPDADHLFAMEMNPELRKLLLKRDNVSNVFGKPSQQGKGLDDKTRTLKDIPRVQLLVGMVNQVNGVHAATLKTDHVTGRTEYETFIMTATHSRPKTVMLQLGKASKRIGKAEKMRVEAVIRGDLGSLGFSCYFCERSGGQFGSILEGSALLCVATSAEVENFAERIHQTLNQLPVSARPIEDFLCLDAQIGRRPDSHSWLDVFGCMDCWPNLRHLRPTSQSE